MRTITANSVEILVPLQINGKEEYTEHKLDVINPSTGKICWQFSVATKEDAIRAVNAADAALSQWSSMKPADKRTIFLKAADILESRSEQFAGFMQTEAGSIVGFSRIFNISKSASMLRDLAGRLVTLESTMPVCGESGRSASMLKVPSGVILGIAPWYA